MQDATLAILAGGQGSRMGMAKAGLRIEGKPILQYLLERMRWEGPTMLVTAPGREHPPGWERFDREVTDPAPGLGPLRGLLTALEQCQTELLLVATVDMPGIGWLQLRWLAERIEIERDALGIMLHHEQYVEPFPSIWRSAAKSLLDDRALVSRRSMRSLADGVSVILLDAPPQWRQSIWTNLNTPADLKTFLDTDL